MPTFNLCVCLFLSNLWKIGKWTTSPLDDTPSRHSGALRSICFELEELKDFLHIPWWLVDGEASTIGRVIQGDPMTPTWSSRISQVGFWMARLPDSAGCYQHLPTQPSLQSQWLRNLLQTPACPPAFSLWPGRQMMSVSQKQLSIIRHIHKRQILESHGNSVSKPG